jgi:hypothetical protein
MKKILLRGLEERSESFTVGHCCLIKITQRSQEEMTKKASSIEFVAH